MEASVFSLLGLVSFTQLSASEGPPPHWVCHEFPPFSRWAVFHCVDGPQSVHPQLVGMLCPVLGKSLGTHVYSFLCVYRPIFICTFSCWIYHLLSPLLKECLISSGKWMEDKKSGILNSSSLCRWFPDDSGQVALLCQLSGEIFKVLIVQESHELCRIGWGCLTMPSLPCSGPGLPCAF